MVFDGKWRAVEVTGGAEYVEAIHSPEEYKLKLRKLGEAIKADPNVYIEELRVTHETIHRTVRINGEIRKDSGEVRLGHEHEGHTGDGRVAKVKIVRESDHKLVRHEHGEGFTSVTVFEVHGEHLIVTAEANGVKFIAKFHKV